MLSPYRIQTHNTDKRTKKTSNTSFINDSHRELDVKRPQMTSKDFKITQASTKLNKKNKSLLKTGSTQENIEINEHYLYEIFHNNDS